MRDFKKEIKEKVLVFDGAMGTMLQDMGLSNGECPEMWNITYSENVRKVYEAYRDAGSDLIETNTFGGSRIKLQEYGAGDRVWEINKASVTLAKEVMGDKGFVALSVGPTGRLLEPYGDLSFNEAYENFKEQVVAGAAAGADLINLETFTDLGEIRAALFAVKENTNLPVMCSMSFEESGRTLMGTSPQVAAIVLEALGVDVIGSNCSGGPEHILRTAGELSEATNLPLLVKPNAGIPHVCCGEMHYDETPEDFAKCISGFIQGGTAVIGGCCGTNPDFIRKIREKVEGVKLVVNQNPVRKFIASSVSVVDCDELKEDEVLKLTVSKENYEQVSEIIMELAGENHKALMLRLEDVDAGSVVGQVQTFLKNPIIFDVNNKEILETCLRYYNGKAGIVASGNNLIEIIDAARKYGAAVVERKFC